MRRVFLSAAALLLLALPATLSARPANPRPAAISVTAAKPFSGVVAVYTNLGKEDTVEDDTATIDWGDGQTSSGTLRQVAPGDDQDVEVSGSHTWSAPGTYQVRVTMDDPNPAAAVETVATATVKVPAGETAPLAALAAATAAPATMERVLFNARGSSDAGGIVKYEWDLNGNGSFELNTGASPLAMASYGEPRRVEAQVRVTDTAGLTSVDTLTLAPHSGLFERGERRFRRQKGIAGAALAPTVTYGPSGPPPTVEKLPEPECPVAVAVGHAEVMADTAGECLSPVKAGKIASVQLYLYKSRRIRLNGISIGTGAGLPMVINPMLGRVSSQGTKVYLSMDGSAAGLGQVNLAKTVVDLKFPKSFKEKTFVAAGNSVPGLGAIGPLKIASIVGAAVIEGGRSELIVQVSAPEPIASYGSAMVFLRASNQEGLAAGAFHLDLLAGKLGSLPIRDISLDVDLDSGEWHGGLAIELPVGVNIDARPTDEYPLNGIGWSPATGLQGGAVVDFAPLGGIPIEPFNVARLMSVNFSFNQENPFLLFGEADVVAGPEILGYRAASARACAFYAAAQPGDRVFVPSCGYDRTFGGASKIFRISGQINVLMIPLGNAFIETENAQGIRFGGDFQIYSCCSIPGLFDVPLIELNGGISGGFAGPYWQVAGKVEGCLFDYACADAGAVVSDTGFAACVPLGVVGWHWGELPDIYWFSGCGSTSPYKSASAYFPSPFGAQAGARAYRVPRGGKPMSFRVSGQDGAPRVALVGPNGERVETPASGRANIGEGTAAYRVPERDAAYLGVKRPAAGVWRLKTLAGSTAIAKVDASVPQPAPRIRARVTGRGAARRLVYSVRGVPPRRVAFAEELDKEGTTAAIGRARAPRGSIPFSPAQGRPGLRRVVALVETPAARVRRPLATYRAPRAARPGRPRVRIRRRGGTLQVTWTRSAGARRYRVEGRLTTGQVVFALTRRRSLTIRGVDRRVGARLSVRGERLVDALGPPGKARLVARGRQRRGLIG